MSDPTQKYAYVTAAVARQLERDELDELIAACEAENGPTDPVAVEEKRAVFSEARSHASRPRRAARRARWTRGGPSSSSSPLARL